MKTIVYLKKLIERMRFFLGHEQNAAMCQLDRREGWRYKKLQEQLQSCTTDDAKLKLALEFVEATVRNNEQCRAILERTQKRAYEMLYSENYGEVQTPELDWAEAAMERCGKLDAEVESLRKFGTAGDLAHKMGNVNAMLGGRLRLADDYYRTLPDDPDAEIYKTASMDQLGKAYSTLKAVLKITAPIQEQAYAQFLAEKALTKPE